MRPISPANPFGYNRYGYLWERLRRCPSDLHLDYGAYDGAVLARLVETDVVAAGVGVDANEQVVRRNASSLPTRATLIHLASGRPLPAPHRSFDSASLLDVIEHVVDQKRVLQDIRRVLTDEGLLVVTAPRQHVLSFLDTGNFKFAFPRLHRMLYVAVKGRSAYHSRYVECANGLFGDIEVGKGRHEHFTEQSMTELLESAGYVVEDIDGAGLFARVIVVFRFLGGAPARRMATRLMDADAKRFSSTHLFCTARKQVPPGPSTDRPSG